MKRSWFGLGLLLVLLAVSLLVTWGMTAIHTPVEGQLHRAEAAAVEDKWEQARAAASQAEAGWNRWRCFRGCFADHTPVEEIDARFARLRSCTEEEFPALAAETAKMVSTIADAHALNLWNFF